MIDPSERALIAITLAMLALGAWSADFVTPKAVHWWFLIVGTWWTMQGIAIMVVHGGRGAKKVVAKLLAKC